MTGFFTPSTLQSQKPQSSTIPQCGACGLHRNCKSPKIPVQGSGKKKILVIGEAPGKEEDKQGRFFVGKSGQLLRRQFADLGSMLEEDCWLYDSLICRPPKSAPPTDEQVVYCRPNVMNLIEEKKPEKIILLGTPPVRSVIGALWKPNPGGIDRWAGFPIPSIELNAWVCPTYHPSFINKTADRDNSWYNPAAAVWWKRHLEQALALEGRPFEKIRDYDSEVQILWTESDIKKACDVLLEDKRPIAIDYETSGLKPDNPSLSIYSVAFSNGKRTFSFLYRKKVKQAVASVLFSSIPKIGANIKFEQRWTLAEFGRPIKGFKWDCVVGSRIRDNRQGITSVKFQAFVLLGYAGDEKQRSYDEVVSAYFDTSGGNEMNSIRELDVTQLLHYGGLDAILEWEIANKQRRMFH